MRLLTVVPLVLTVAAIPAPYLQPAPESLVNPILNGSTQYESESVSIPFLMAFL
jgi:hypothetical protein